MKHENVEKIEQSLEFMNIKKIVSIDNEWIQNNDIDLSKDITDFIEDMHPQNEKELLRKISNEGYITIQDVYDAKDEEIIKFIESKKQNQLPPDLKKLNDVLIALQSKGIIIEKIAKYKPDIFKKYSNQNCLFILDKEMDGNDNEDIIKESIPNILKEANRNKINHLIITYSSNIGKEYTSNEEKIKYVQEKIKNHDSNYSSDYDISNFYIFKMFAIEKKAETELDKELNSKILDCIYGDAIYRYMMLEKKKNEKAYDLICKIENEEIARISNENIIEGNNIKDSIDTVKKAIIKIKENEKEYEQEEKRILEEFNFYQKNKTNDFILENANLSSSNQYGKYRKKQNIEFIENILSSEIAIWENIDYSVNKFYKDILTGDIFKIKLLQDEKEKYLIIIENACNCILRNQNNINDIARRCRNGGIKVLLLEKGKISEIKKDAVIEQFNNGEIILPVKENDEIYYLKTTEKILSIPQIVLDLCTLNEEGKCLLNYKKEIIKKYKSFYFEKYMDMPNTIKEIENIKQYLLIGNSNMKNVLEMQENTEYDIKPFQIERGKEKNLCIERIGRLDYSITLGLCQKIYNETEDQIFNDIEKYIHELREQRKTTIIAKEKMVGINNDRNKN